MHDAFRWASIRYVQKYAHDYHGNYGNIYSDDFYYKLISVAMHQIVGFPKE